MPKNMPIVDRWWQKVDRRGDDDCWPWTASRDRDGYGRFQYPTPAGQYHTRAHRYAYETFVGPVPDGHQVCHTCDHPWCVNYLQHLFTGTNLENDADKRAKGRASTLWGRPLNRSRQTHCLHGHPLSGDNLRIMSTGYRRCRTCERDRARMHYWRTKGLPQPGEGGASGVRSA